MEKLNQRLIAFLDILGFSKMLFEEPLDTIYGKYSSFIEIAKNTTFFTNPNDQFQRKNFYTGKFISDSVLLVSEDISDIYNVNNFLMAINNLLDLGFRNRFYLRGSIGLGDIILDDEKGIFISEIIPSLLEEEKSQEWAGCTILENAIDVVLNSVGGIGYDEHIKNSPNQSDLILFYPVQTKKGVKNSYVLHSSYSLSSDIKNEGLNYLIEPKKRNQEIFFRYLDNLPKDMQSQISTNMRLLKTRSGFCLSLVEN